MLKNKLLFIVVAILFVLHFIEVQCPPPAKKPQNWAGLMNRKLSKQESIDQTNVNKFTVKHLVAFTFSKISHCFSQRLYPEKELPPWQPPGPFADKLKFSIDLLKHSTEYAKDLDDDSLQKELVNAKELDKYDPLKNEKNLLLQFILNTGYMMNKFYFGEEDVQKAVDRKCREVLDFMFTYPINSTNVSEQKAIRLFVDRKFVAMAKSKYFLEIARQKMMLQFKLTRSQLLANHSAMVTFLDNFAHGLFHVRHHYKLTNTSSDERISPSKFIAFLRGINLWPKDDSVDQAQLEAVIEQAQVERPCDRDLHCQKAIICKEVVTAITLRSVISPLNWFSDLMLTDEGDGTRSAAYTSALEIINSNLQKCIDGKYKWPRWNNVNEKMDLIYTQVLISSIGPVLQKDLNRCTEPGNVQCSSLTENTMSPASLTTDRSWIRKNKWKTVFGSAVVVGVLATAGWLSYKLWPTNIHHFTWPPASNYFTESTVASIVESVTSPDSSPKSGHLPLYVIILIVISAFLVFILLVLLALFLIRRYRLAMLLDSLHEDIQTTAIWTGTREAALKGGTSTPATTTATSADSQGTTTK